MRELACLMWAAPLLAQPAIEQIIERSLAASDRNWKIAQSYTFIERNDQRQLDSDGRVKSRRVLTYDITLLEGSPYRRLIARDDKPLPPAEEQKEQEKLTKSIAERRKETEAERAKRIADFQRRRQRELDLVRELPKAFAFRVVGEESVGGAASWVLDATPRPGYQPRDSRTRVLPKVKGRLWISQQDYAWVKVDAEVIDTISIGLFLARIGKGSHLEFEQVQVNGEVWLPSRLALVAEARVALVKKINLAQEIAYQDYRKFQSESRIVSTEEVR